MPSQGGTAVLAPREGVLRAAWGSSISHGAFSVTELGPARAEVPHGSLGSLPQCHHPEGWQRSPGEIRE